MDSLKPYTDTGVETVTTTHEPSVIKSVFKAILIETVKDFFVNIFVFLRKYVRHYGDSLSYLWNPSFKNKRLLHLNWKEHCQQTFELAILLLVAVIFLVKLEWIPKGSHEVMEMLGNDLSQMAVEVMLFLGFAITFIIATFLSVATGRVLRLMFEIPVTPRQSDILFTYLNNVSFTLMLVFIFIFRCSFSLLSIGDETETTLSAMWVLLFLLLLPVIILWCIRFGKKNRLEAGKIFLFTIIFSLPLTLMYSFGTTFLAAFLFNI